MTVDRRLTPPRATSFALPPFSHSRSVPAPERTKVLGAAAIPGIPPSPTIVAFSRNQHAQLQRRPAATLAWHPGLPGRSTGSARCSDVHLPGMPARQVGLLLLPMAMVV